jgi:hypothetical protein
MFMVVRKKTEMPKIEVEEKVESKPADSTIINPEDYKLKLDVNGNHENLNPLEALIIRKDDNTRVLIVKGPSGNIHFRELRRSKIKREADAFFQVWLLENARNFVGTKKLVRLKISDYEYLFRNQLSGDTHEPGILEQNYVDGYDPWGASYTEIKPDEIIEKKSNPAPKRPIGIATRLAALAGMIVASTADYKPSADGRTNHSLIGSAFSSSYEARWKEVLKEDASSHIIKAIYQNLKHVNPHELLEILEKAKVTFAQGLSNTAARDAMVSELRQDFIKLWMPTFIDQNFYTDSKSQPIVKSDKKSLWASEILTDERLMASPQWHTIISNLLELGNYRNDPRLTEFAKVGSDDYVDMKKFMKSIFSNEKIRNHYIDQIVASRHLSESSEREKIRADLDKELRFFGF